MWYQKYFSILIMTHLSCSGAAGDMELSMWQEADLRKSIQVIVPEGLTSTPHITNTHIECKPDGRSLLVRTSVIMHGDNRISRVFARQAASDDFDARIAAALSSANWLEACQEVSRENAKNADSIKVKQQEILMGPMELASITLMRTSEHAWPRHLIQTKYGESLLYKACTDHDEQPDQDLFAITPYGISNSFKGLERLALEDSTISPELLEYTWVKSLELMEHIGIKVDYQTFNQVYEQLFPAQ